MTEYMKRSPVVETRFIYKDLFEAEIENLETKLDAVDKNLKDKLDSSDEYFNHKLEANDRNMTTRLDGMDIALSLKEKVLDHRLGELNQLRRDVVEDRETFVKKDAYEIKMEMIDKMDSRMTVLETRLVAIFSGLLLIFAAAQFLLHYWKG